MIIDFHTHIFPEKIAPRAIASLQDGVRRVEGVESEAYTDATYGGLVKSMDENGVNMSIVLPIVTNPEKPDGINNYAETIRNSRVLSLGSVHPMQENAPDAVRELKSRGFIGIKMHPEFQQCYIDSPESLAVLKAAEEENMLVVLHTGADIGIPPPVHCTPKQLKNALGYVEGSNIVAAHLGGWRQWEEVYDTLALTPIYMDIAFIADYIDADLCRAIIKKHGADKILFGSDSPWETPAHTLKFLQSLDLGAEAEEKIKSENAKVLLARHGVCF